MAPMEDMEIHFGRYIRQKRLRARLSLDRMAEKAGISGKRLWQIEQMKESAVLLGQTIEGIARAIDTTADQLEAAWKVTPVPIRAKNGYRKTLISLEAETYELLSVLAKESDETVAVFSSGILTTVIRNYDRYLKFAATPTPPPAAPEPSLPEAETLGPVQVRLKRRREQRGEMSHNARPATPQSPPPPFREEVPDTEQSI
jgi:transcriptional regulator with XRE-family HTH domain